MATINFRATGTAASASAVTSLAITKPTGLAVGDIMVANINTNGGTVAGPMGWTTIVSSGNCGMFYKIADSADVAASTFTFTFTSGAVIGRISAFYTSNAATITVQSNYASQSETTALSTSGITPSVEMGTMLILTSIFHNSVDSTAVTISGQAIATNNPTWTEQYDAGQTVTGSNTTVNVSMAYASRPHISATGSATATSSSSTGNSSIIAIVHLMPPATTVFSAALSLVAPVVRWIEHVISATFSVVDPTFSDVSPDFSNKQKTSSTWSNKQKS